jgi:hypothetical protein
MFGDCDRGFTQGLRAVAAGAGTTLRATPR